MTEEDFELKGKRAVTGNDEDNDNLPWVEKYRPNSLNDVYGQESIVATIKKFISTNRIPHLLFYGPPGTGKTSTIIAVAREIYGKNYRNMVLELNASDERGIDVVRDQIKTFASTKQIFSSGFKLIILDEADAMTSQAQNALRRIIEKYTAHTRFCILANYTHKIAPALLSRCTRFRFSPLSTDAVRSRLDYVIEKESVNLSPEAHDALLDLCGGDMRRALNVLQACKAAVDHGDRISEEMVYDCVGSPRPGDVKAILNAILNQDWPTALDSINVIKQAKGLALADILSSITLQLKDLQLKNVTMASLLDGLSEVEWRLSTGGNEAIQTSACIGVIKSSIELEAK